MYGEGSYSLMNTNVNPHSYTWNRDSTSQICGRFVSAINLDANALDDSVVSGVSTIGSKLTMDMTCADTTSRILALFVYHDKLYTVMPNGSIVVTE